MSVLRRLAQSGRRIAPGPHILVGNLGDIACGRLQPICVRKNWAQEVLPYNKLVIAWSEVGRLAVEKMSAGDMQGRCDFWEHNKLCTLAKARSSLTRAGYNPHGS